MKHSNKNQLVTKNENALNNPRVKELIREKVEMAKKELATLEKEIEVLELQD